MALCYNCVSCLGNYSGNDGLICCSHRGVAQEKQLSGIYTARVVKGQGYVLVLPRLICDYHSFVPVRKPEPRLVHNPVNWLEYKEVYDANSSRV